MQIAEEQVRVISDNVFVYGYHLHRPLLVFAKIFELSFLHQSRYAFQLESTGASYCIVPELCNIRLRVISCLFPACFLNTIETILEFRQELMAPSDDC